MTDPTHASTAHRSPDRADAFRQHVLRALRIADDAVLTLVQTECVAQRDAAGQPAWWNTQPLTDPREYSAPLCDLHGQMLTYGTERHLLLRHAAHPHLVRLQPRRAPTL